MPCLPRETLKSRMMDHGSERRKVGRDGGDFHCYIAAYGHERPRRRRNPSVEGRAGPWEASGVRRCYVAFPGVGKGLSEEDTGGNQVATQVSVRRYLILAAMIWAALARFRWRITQSNLVFHLLTLDRAQLQDVERHVVGQPTPEERGALLLATTPRVAPHDVHHRRVDCELLVELLRCSRSAASRLDTVSASSSATASATSSWCAASATSASERLMASLTAASSPRRTARSPPRDGPCQARAARLCGCRARGRGRAACAACESHQLPWSR